MSKLSRGRTLCRRLAIHAGQTGQAVRRKVLDKAPPQALLVRVDARLNIKHVEGCKGFVFYYFLLQLVAWRKTELARSLAFTLASHGNV